MLLSMTGHGQAFRRLEGYSIDVEVRTVNNRFLKISTKLSDHALAIEPELEGIVRDFVKRGSVTLSVRVASTGDADSSRINHGVLSAYLREAKQAAISADIPLKVELASFFTLPGVLELRLHEENSELDECIRETCRAALLDLQEMRQAEGAAMSAKFREYSTTIREMRSTIEKRAPAVVQDYRARIEQRVKSILDDRGISVQTVDLVREVAMFADRADISEEVTRLGSHLDQFDKALESSESQGRRLDFLLQELGRETNTIGSKANDADISNLVVTIKTILEQIRELVQNIE